MKSSFELNQWGDVHITIMYKALLALGIAELEGSDVQNQANIEITYTLNKWVHKHKLLEGF